MPPREGFGLTLRKSTRPAEQIAMGRAIQRGIFCIIAFFFFLLSVPSSKEGRAMGTKRGLAP